MKKYGLDRSWPFAQGGGATILVSTALLVSLIILWANWPSFLSGSLLVMAIALWLLILYFFRDPNRDITSESGLVVGPGDGEIIQIVAEEELRYLQSQVIRLSMFLSITDVHVQRVPLAGQVTLIDHQPGKFLQAFRPEASEVNEYIGMVIESAYGRILVKQIAGILARRCVNYVRTGDQVITGQRFGLIRFSSRIDLFLPAGAQILVQVGSRVLGGLTPIARLAPPHSPQT
jgi:phosphatidylserine decarboxylase